MNSKERVLMAVNHMEPDRVPIFESFVPEEVKKINAYFNYSQFFLNINLC